MYGISKDLNDTFVSLFWGGFKIVLFFDDVVLHIFWWTIGLLTLRCCLVPLMKDKRKNTHWRSQNWLYSGFNPFEGIWVKLDHFPKNTKNKMCEVSHSTKWSLHICLQKPSSSDFFEVWVKSKNPTINSEGAAGSPRSFWTNGTEKWRNPEPQLFGCFTLGVGGYPLT